MRLTERTGERDDGGARHVGTRKADTEDLFRESMSVWLSDFCHLDLQPAPPFCNARAPASRLAARVR